MDTGITKLTLKSYKSIDKEKSIEIKPLTILAGANSSGKSSFIQPLLLMKQTLESSFDSGALLINGSNIHFSSYDQFISKGKKLFSIGISSDYREIKVFFKKDKKSLEIDKMEYTDNYMVNIGTSNEVKIIPINNSKDKKTILPNMKHEDIVGYLPTNGIPNNLFKYTTQRYKCFLDLFLYTDNQNGEKEFYKNTILTSNFERRIKEIIHLPGIRGNPERVYPVTFVPQNDSFMGRFENYVASIIHNLQENKNLKILKSIGDDLEILGISKNIKATKINDASIELKVSRTKSSTDDDLVNISDVGLGVSQALPIIVALNIAREHQIVYIEQPELHLHPKAQVNMAKVLAKASKKGVKVIIETHSSLLLLAIQTLIAEDKLDKTLVKLHWFTQNESGSTEISSADLDENGAFGDWDEDFGEVELKIQSQYLDAVEAKMMR